MEWGYYDCSFKGITSLVVYAQKNMGKVWELGIFILIGVCKPRFNRVPTDPENRERDSQFFEK